MNDIERHVFICEECGFDWRVFCSVAAIFSALPALFIVTFLPYSWQMDLLLIAGMWMIFLIGTIAAYWLECD